MQRAVVYEKKFLQQQVLEENFKNCMQIPFIVVCALYAGWREREKRRNMGMSGAFAYSERTEWNGTGWEREIDI